MTTQKTSSLYIQTYFTGEPPFKTGSAYIQSGKSGRHGGDQAEDEELVVLHLPAQPAELGHLPWAEEEEAHRHQPQR